MKTIYFDLDDTLIPTQELYNKIKKEVSEYISSITNIEIEEIVSLFEKIDLENAKSLGLSKTRFPKSWVDTYKQIKGIHQNKKETHIINKLANQVFERRLPPFQGITQILKAIKSKGFKIYILTSGDKEIQTQRIISSGIQDLFDGVHIVPSKNKDVMLNIVKVPCESIMVGNSLKSDIEPALSIGMKAIHIERETWGFDNAVVDELNSNYYRTTLDKIQDLLDLISAEGVY